MSKSSTKVPKRKSAMNGNASTSMKTTLNKSAQVFIPRGNRENTYNFCKYLLYHPLKMNICTQMSGHSNKPSRKCKVMQSISEQSSTPISLHTNTYNHNVCCFNNLFFYPCTHYKYACLDDRASRHLLSHI